MENFIVARVVADGKRVKLRNIGLNAVHRKARKCIDARGQESTRQSRKDNADCAVKRNALGESDFFIIESINRVILQSGVDHGNLNFVLGSFKRRKGDTLASYVFFHACAVACHSESGNHIVHDSNYVIIRRGNSLFVDKVEDGVIVDLGNKFIKGMTVGISVLGNKAGNCNRRGAVADNDIVKPCLAVYRRSRARMSGKNLQLSAVGGNRCRGIKRRAGKPCQNEQDEQERAKPFYFQEHDLLSLFLNPRPKGKTECRNKCKNA